MDHLFYHMRLHGYHAMVKAYAPTLSATFMRVRPVQGGGIGCSHHTHGLTCRRTAARARHVTQV